MLVELGHNNVAYDHWQLFFHNRNMQECSHAQKLVSNIIFFTYINNLRHIKQKHGLWMHNSHCKKHKTPGSQGMQKKRVLMQPLPKTEEYNSILCRVNLFLKLSLPANDINSKYIVGIPFLNIQWSRSPSLMWLLWVKPSSSWFLLLLLRWFIFSMFKS